MSALKTKTKTASGKIYVDLGFWGGLTPDNTQDLAELLNGGVMGLQCSLSPLADPVGQEMPAITAAQLDNILWKLPDATLIAIHAEEPLKMPIAANESEPKVYESFLRTRPPQMEVNAVQAISELVVKHKK